MKDCTSVAYAKGYASQLQRIVDDEEEFIYSSPYKDDAENDKSFFNGEFECRCDVRRGGLSLARQVFDYSYKKLIPNDWEPV